MIEVLYQDKNITITTDFIALPGHDPESIPLGKITEMRISRKVVRDYTAAAVLFLIIGVLTTPFLIGWYLIFVALVAWLVKRYDYHLDFMSGYVPIARISNKRKAYLRRLIQVIITKSKARVALKTQSSQ